MKTLGRRLVAAGLGALMAIGMGCKGQAAGEPSRTDTIDVSARMALSGILASEAAGTRLDELLGFNTSDVYHRNVEHGSEEEPGWDSIEIRKDFSVGSMACTQHAGRGTRCTAQVKFGPGWWFSRESYGPLEAGTTTYVLILAKGRFYLVAPMLQPFLSGGAAKRFLGKPPYDSRDLLTLIGKL